MHAASKPNLKTQVFSHTKPETRNPKPETSLLTHYPKPETGNPKQVSHTPPTPPQWGRITAPGNTLETPALSMRTRLWSLTSFNSCHPERESRFVVCGSWFVIYCPYTRQLPDVCPRYAIMHHLSLIIYHLSRIAYHSSLITHDLSFIIYHVSIITYHV